MGAQENVARTRASYEAFAKGDLETVGKNMTDDIVWHVGGQSPLAGEYKGQDEIFGFFGKLFELSGATLQLEVHDVMASDEHVTALVHMTAQRGDKRFDQNEVHVFHVDAEGKAKEFWSFEEDQRAGDEFWS
jgi:hypothetical protein